MNVTEYSLVEVLLAMFFLVAFPRGEHEPRILIVTSGKGFQLKLCGDVILIM